MKIPVVMGAIVARKPFLKKDMGLALHECEKSLSNINAEFDRVHRIKQKNGYKGPKDKYRSGLETMKDIDRYLCLGRAQINGFIDSYLSGDTQITDKGRRVHAAQVLGSVCLNCLVSLQLLLEDFQKSEAGE